MLRTLLWSFLVGVALGAETFTCPPDESTGKFADPDSCNEYWECFRGEATKKYCLDGYGFDPSRVQMKEPCDFLASVDCRGRDLVNDPLGTGVCYRRNGVYEHEDPQVCDKYYSCKEDVPTLEACPPGLHFNLDLKICDWPKSANRGACGALQSVDEFTCDPTQEYFTSSNQKIVHPTFPHPDNCQLFYVCKNGIVPSISRCDEGLVYSLDTNACEDPAIVPDCANHNSTAADLTPRS